MKLFDNSLMFIIASVLYTCISQSCAGPVKLNTKALADHHMRELFHEWIFKFNKNYEADAEYLNRFQIWQNKYLEIQMHNLEFAQGLVSYTKGLNQFSDLTDEEFTASRGNTLRESQTSTDDLNSTDSSSFFGVQRGERPPSSRDWRRDGAVTSVREQGNCGSCWAHAAAGAIEGQLALQKGNLEVVSVQQVLDCTDQDGCEGGISRRAFDMWKRNPIASERSYPYVGYDRYACDEASHSLGTVRARYSVRGESELERFVGLYGPVSVAVDADVDWRDYSGGLYQGWCGSSEDELDHEVLAVGYTEEYWIVKNSWGTRWGERGYIRLPRGQNPCGIATDASFATLN